MTTPSFNGLRVLAFESRLSNEMAALIANHGGKATVAPAMQEVAIGGNTDAAVFAAALQRGEFDIVVFLTGVGARLLMKEIADACPQDRFAAALARVKIVARGPKPLAVMRELQVPVWVTAPEPNTWRELLTALDAAAGSDGLRGKRVAVQEYGVSNDELLDGLRARGALVTAVPVYQWALPDDVRPLENAVMSIVSGGVDVVIFTTRIQVTHLWQIAERMAAASSLPEALRHTVVASIGPTTSEELQRHGVAADLEPSHPKIGFLVRETAERAAAMLARKRGKSGEP